MAQQEVQNTAPDTVPTPSAESCTPVQDVPTIVRELCGLSEDVLRRAIDSPDAVKVASEIGRLDVVSTSLAVLGVLLGLSAMIGFWMIRREAIANARDAAEGVTPDIVSRIMDDSGDDMIRRCLRHPAVVARLQVELIRLGIEDADTAADVDTDAERKETEDGESDG